MLSHSAHFMKILHILMMAGIIALAGCSTASKMNSLNLGMTKQEVISAMGQPSSTAAPGGGVEILRYHLSPTSWPDNDYATTKEYFVRLVNGKAASYGKMGDFDSTKDPTLNVNIKNR
jgi:hypothetical protein